MPPEKYLNFVNNKELLESMAKDMYQACKERIELMGMEFPYTEEDFVNCTKDQKRIDNYLRAREILDKERATRNRYEEFFDKKIITKSVNRGVARHASILLSGEDTPEAYKKDLDIINSLTTTIGAENEANKELKEIMNFDITELNCKSEEDCLSFVEKHPQLPHFAFIAQSMLDNGHFSIDDETSKFFKNNSTLIQSIKTPYDTLAKLGSNNNLIMPDLPEELLAPISDVLYRQMEKYRDQGVPGYAPKVPTNPLEDIFTENYIVTSLTKENSKTFLTGFNYLIEKGTITKDFLFDTEAYDEKGEIQYKEAAISEYGKHIRDYENLIKEGKTTSTLDEYLKEQNINASFKKLDNEKIGYNIEKFKKENIIYSSKDIAFDIETKIENIEATIKDKGEMRYKERGKEVNDFIHKVFTDENFIKVGGIRPAKQVLNQYAVGALLKLEEKHASRSSLWKLFYKDRYNEEQKAIDEAIATIKKEGKLTDKEINEQKEEYKDIKNSISKEINDMKDFNKLKDALQQHKSQSMLNRSETVLSGIDIDDIHTRSNTEEIIDELDLGNKSLDSIKKPNLDSKKLDALNKLKNLANDTDMTSSKAPTSKAKEDVKIQSPNKDFKID